MADSDNTRTLPEFTRRSIFRYAALVPAGVSALAHPINPVLAIARDWWRHENAANATREWITGKAPNRPLSQKREKQGLNANQAAPKIAGSKR